MLTAGERHEPFALDVLMGKRVVPRQGRSRPRPRRTAGDRSYSSPPARRRLRHRRIEPVILTRKDQPCKPAAHAVRRVATRYEKRAALSKFFEIPVLKYELS